MDNNTLHWLVLNAGSGEILAVRATRESAEETAAELDDDFAGAVEVRVKPKWYSEMSAAMRSEVDQLATVARHYGL